MKIGKEIVMRRKKGNNGLFIVFVIVAIVMAVVLMNILPAAVSEWKQLVFFGTVIAVTALEMAVYKMVKR